MGYTYYQVNWYSDNGEECSEDFDSKLEAMAFLEYNDFGKKAHPKIHTIDATHDVDENGNLSTNRIMGKMTITGGKRLR